MLRNAEPPDAGQSMIVMPLSGPGGRSTAREAASLPFATLATTAELHAVQSSSGGEGLPPRQNGKLVSTHLVGSIGCLSSCAGCLSIQPLLRPSLPGARDVALPRGSSPAKAERRALRYRDNKDISPLGLLLQTEKQIWRACAQGLLVL